MKAHHDWMKRSLALAKRALGKTYPNPLVGAIVLGSNGKKLGEGFHEQAGKAHAEIVALSQAGRAANGGTLYCTLEPCNHQGRVGPCTEAILQAGIKKVIIASLDVNPQVCGRGKARLESAGIEVVTGILANQEASLNAPFRKWIKAKLPLVTAKFAVSADGYIGSREKRLLISSRQTLKTTMRLRAEAQAIIVGVATANIDDPLLTVRDARYPSRDPLKVILDSRLRISTKLKLFKQPERLMLVCHQSEANSPKARVFRNMGLEVFGLPQTSTHGLDLKNLLTHLGQREFTAVLVEGGAATLTNFYTQKLVDRWVIYQSPVHLTPKFSPGELVKCPLSEDFFRHYKKVVRRGPDLEAWITPA